MAGHNKTGSMAEAGGFVEQQRLPYYNIFCVCVSVCSVCVSVGNGPFSLKALDGKL